jgi:hypothetical protein
MENNKKVTVAALASAIVESFWAGPSSQLFAPVVQEKASGEPPSNDGTHKNVVAVSEEQRAELQANRKEARRTFDINVMRKHVTSKDMFARSSLAENKQVTEEFLTILVGDSAKWVRQNVAANKNTPTAMLETLAKDSWAAVRIAVAQNPNTPLSVLEDLIHDRLPFLAGYVFTNKSATPEMKSLIVNSEYAQMAMSLGLTVLKERADDRTRFLRDSQEAEEPSSSQVAI